MIKRLTVILAFIIGTVCVLIYTYPEFVGERGSPPYVTSLLRESPQTISIKSPLWDLKTEFPVQWETKTNPSGNTDYRWSGVIGLNPESPGIVIQAGSKEIEQVSSPTDLTGMKEGFFFDPGPAPIHFAKQIRFNDSVRRPYDVSIPSGTTWIRLECKRISSDSNPLIAKFSLDNSWEGSIPIDSVDWNPMFVGPINIPGGTHVLNIQVDGTTPGTREAHIRNLSLVQATTVQVSLADDSPPPRLLRRPHYPTRSYLSGEGVRRSETHQEWVESPWNVYDEDSRWVYPLEIQRLVRTSLFLPSPSEFRIGIKAKKGSILKFYPGIQNRFDPDTPLSGTISVFHQHDEIRTKIWEGTIEGVPIGNERIHDQFLQPWQVQKTRAELDQPLWREGVRIPLSDMMEGEHSVVIESRGADDSILPAPLYIGEPAVFPPPNLKDFGPSLTAEEILDWNGLLEKLIQSGLKKSPTPERRIWLSMDWESRVLLGRVDPAGEIEDSSKEILIESLNNVLADPKFYSKDYFKSSSFPKEVYDLVGSGGDDGAADGPAELNRLIFENTFPNEILQHQQFEPTPKNRPNIILISLDTLRGDSLSCLGYPRGTTPWMRDYFEEDGVRFTNANSTASWTLPAHTSLFLSQYVNRHGIVHDFQSVPTHTDTLSEYLCNRGYETAAFVDRGFLHHHYGMYQGFQGYQEKGGGFHRILPECITYLEQRDRTSPLFLFLHTFDIHDPYMPPHPFRDRFLLDSMAPSRVDFAVPNYEIVLATNAGVVELTRADRDYAKALYDAQIIFVDQKLREFFDTVEKKRLLENTLVILMSDHGEAFGEHGFWGHGWTVYEEVTHIPLLIHFPDDKFAGRSIEERVSLVDIAPTIADYLGLPIPEHWQGESLMPLIRDPESEFERRTYAQYGGNYAMYQGFLKLMENRNPHESPLNEKYMPERAVFDLKTDPYEETNLIHDPPIPASEEFGRLRQTLDIMAMQRESEGEIDHVELNSEQVQELQALGYLK